MVSLFADAGDPLSRSAGFTVEEEEGDREERRASTRSTREGIIEEVVEETEEVVVSVVSVAVIWFVL